MPQSRFAALLSQHDLPPSLIYLAPVLPVVQVMWADGRNQIPERAKLQVIIQDHCRALAELAGGMEVVSQTDIDIFDRTFVAQKPDPTTLSPFFEVASELLGGRSDAGKEESESLYQREKLFQACLEIAATCPADMGRGSGEMFARRIVDAERRYIEQVFELLPRTK
ncbi:hypothetical protein Q667_17975 [Marinobacter sp. C1S70]|uniref:hypothetical protein n=1 Tax=Marinobacter sp. C1S70 TaxID=1396859 RepID=UPI0003B8F9FF|nr:hypothetical protein [Marinobacter sp. C1S70]ERS84739.1 hypothetical protein Q667_17975 [Marinobacter sp. C1S70]